jgi:hypothetical protein
MHFADAQHSSHSDSEAPQTAVVRETLKSTLSRVPPAITEETPDEAKSTKQIIGDIKISPEATSLAGSDVEYF